MTQRYPPALDCRGCSRSSVEGQAGSMGESRLLAALLAALRSTSAFAAGSDPGPHLHRGVGNQPRW